MRGLQFMFVRLLTVVLILSSSVAGAASQRLNGIADLSVSGIYKAKIGLYVSEFSKDPEAILSNDQAKIEMEWRFTGDRVSSRGFLRSLFESVAVNATAEELDIFGKDLLSFHAMIRRDFELSDQLRINISSFGVIIHLNYTQLGVIESREFGKLLLKGWIGSVPISSAAKAQLLAGGVIDEEALKAFRKIVPSKQRLSENVGADGEKFSGYHATQADGTFKFKEPLDIEDSWGVKSRQKLKKVVKSNILPVVSFDSHIPQGASRLERAYLRHLRKQIARNVYYPEKFRKMGLAGTVSIDVKVDPLGMTIGSLKEIREGAAPKQLVAAAKISVKAASPLSPIPKELKVKQYRFVLEITYTP